MAWCAITPLLMVLGEQCPSPASGAQAGVEQCCRDAGHSVLDEAHKTSADLLGP